MAEVVVHPGFMRTGTTTLQEAVFGELPGVNYLGRPFSDRELAAAVYAVCKTDGIRYSPGAVQEVVASRLVAGRINVLSYENLASYKCKDKQQVAGRIKDLFPGATILFTIRNQRDLVRSWYLLQRRPPRTYMSFEAWWKGIAGDPTRNVLDDLNFYDVISCYDRLFGRERVHVIAYETLRDAPGVFARSLAAATGLDEAGMSRAIRTRRLNQGATKRELTWARLISDYVPGTAARTSRRVMPRRLSLRLDRWLADGPPPEITLSRDQERLIANLCAAGNRCLAERSGLPLAELGYPL